jgi:divalent metal cation (Fe/Co/Zn/Cd) transporter
VAERITAAVAGVAGVRRVSRVRVRGVGSQTFVDLRVAVPRHLSFEESHAVSRQVQEAVHSISPNADVVVHAFPVADSEGVLERVQAIAAQGHFAIHNVTTHWTAKGMWIDLDMEVDPNITLVRAHALATDLESRLHAEFGTNNSGVSGKVADINVHIEPRAEELVKASEMTPKQAARYIDQIEAIRRDLAHAHSVQDVQLQQLDGKVYVSFHILLDADCPIAEVHSISEEMENRLRREFPQLGRVVIHAEPFVAAKK